MHREYIGVYQEIGGGWVVAIVPELPGAITRGKTLQEAREMIKEAVALLLESYRDHDATKDASLNAVWDTLSIDLPPA
jgi:predicted RNase H-like HicB family nuclease